MLFFTGLRHANSLLESIQSTTKPDIFWKYEAETLCWLFRFRIGLVSPPIHPTSYITTHVGLYVFAFVCVNQSTICNSESHFYRFKNCQQETTADGFVLVEAEMWRRSK